MTVGDLQRGWERSGRAKEDMPENITMMDLRTLVKQMQVIGRPVSAPLTIHTPSTRPLLRPIPPNSHAPWLSLAVAGFLAKSTASKGHVALSHVLLAASCGYEVTRPMTVRTSPVPSDR